MSNVVDPAANFADNFEFVTDLARFRENLLTEAQVRKKWRLSNETYEKLGDDDLLIRKVEEESIRRVKDGSCKRERAQLHVTRAPDVLATILDDPNASPRHRIDSAKALDDFAANGPAAAPAGDRFIIQINLGADSDGRPVIEKFNKSIAIDANDIDPDNTGMVAAIAAKKSTDGGNGEPV